MKYFLLFFITVLSLSCGQTIYVVRHAEKAPPVGNNADVALSAEGQQRAQNLKTVLADKHIAAVYSTNTIRTKSTAQPTADYFHLDIKIYGPRPDSSFIRTIKSFGKNVLIVGHSNTIDDVANMITGELSVPADIPDAEYDNLFILKKKGGRFVLKRERY